MTIKETIVIGSGISGMTAAIYLKRANVDFIIFEKSAPGGVINKTAQIDNYPGLKEVDSVTFSMNMYDQMNSMEVDYRYGNITSIEEEGDLIKLTTEEGEIFYSKTIIMATGRIPRSLGLPNEEKLIGRGISWCAICDGNFYKNKDVAMIGGGNSALEEAIYISSLAKKVYLIIRGREFKADPYVVEKVSEIENIEIIIEAEVKEIYEVDNKLSGIKLSNNRELKIDGMFLYIGFDPDVKMLNVSNLEQKNGYLVVNKHMQTTNKKIYAIGDVTAKEIYQLTTAAADGTIAALSIKESLK